MKWNCKDCGYSIERNERPVSCPYCGKKDEMEIEKSAQVLLEEL